MLNVDFFVNLGNNSGKEFCVFIVLNTTVHLMKLVFDLGIEDQPPVVSLVAYVLYMTLKKFLIDSTDMMEFWIVKLPMFLDFGH